MTTETVSICAGVLLSLVLSYVPGVSGWYGALAAANKQLVFLAAVLLAMVLSFVLACSGIAIGIFPVAACTQAGVIEAVNVFLYIAIGGVVAYGATSKLGKSGG